MGRKSKTIVVFCYQCQKAFETIPSDMKDGRGKYCSLICSRNRPKVNRPKPFINSGQFKIGNTPWIKGKSLGKGNKHNRWKSGRTFHPQGYVFIYQPDHPFALSGKYIAEHRFIMERCIGRYLRTNEVVHHINGITNDNRIENLELMDASEHIRFHNKYRLRDLNGKFIT